MLGRLHIHHDEVLGACDCGQTPRALAAVMYFDGQVLWAGSPRDVVAIRRIPRFLQARRLQVVLGDGSWLALMSGMFLTRNAPNVVRAWRQLPR